MENNYENHGKYFSVTIND